MLISLLISGGKSDGFSLFVWPRQCKLRWVCVCVNVTGAQQRVRATQPFRNHYIKFHEPSVHKKGRHWKDTNLLFRKGVSEEIIWLIQPNNLKKSLKLPKWILSLCVWRSVCVFVCCARGRENSIEGRLQLVFISIRAGLFFWLMFF